MKITPEISLKFLQWTVTRIGVVFVAMLGILTQTSGNAAMENFILMLLRFLFLLGAISLAAAFGLFIASIKDQIITWIRESQSKAETILAAFALFIVPLIICAVLTMPILMAFNYAAKDMQTENRYEIRATVDELFRKLNPKTANTDD